MDGTEVIKKLNSINFQLWITVHIVIENIIQIDVEIFKIMVFR